MRHTFAVAVLTVSLLAQAPQQPAQRGDAPSEQTIMRIARDIQKSILTLPNYGVFDSLRFSFNGYNVILKGYASRPTLKDSAERVVKQVEGVAQVDNRIEVLPLSPNDDQIRAATYVRIYGHPAMRRYRSGGPIIPSLAMAAGGITADPPLGWHAIHIIVKNGNVTLEGVVGNSGDKAIAGIQANQVPGAFAVENELMIENQDERRSAGKQKKQKSS